MFVITPTHPKARVLTINVAFVLSDCPLWGDEFFFVSDVFFSKRTPGVLVCRP